MKISKYLFIFSSLLSILVVSYIFILAKFLPILVHHTFYYCREMARIISTKLPGNVGVVIFGVLTISILYTTVRLIATIIRIYKFRERLSQSVLTDHNLGDEIVVMKENKPFAYCFGIISPKIFITTGLLTIVNKKELEIILRHERYHLEHRDSLTLLLATFVESLFPFAPILTDLIRIYKVDRELLADQSAIRDESDKKVLISILKKLLLYEPMPVPSFAPGIAEIETLETRIKSLLNLKITNNKPSAKNVTYSLIFVVILIGLMTTPIRAIEVHRTGLDAIVVCK